MAYLEEELRQVTEVVWDSVLGHSLIRMDQSPDPSPRAVAAWVHITGAWEGAVVLECSGTAAQSAAAIMFGGDPAAITVMDIQDAMGELANMTGGNVKALLPSPASLSLPTVIDGCDWTTRIPGAELLTEVAFEWSGEPIKVKLIAKSQERV